MTAYSASLGPVVAYILTVPCTTTYSWPKKESSMNMERNESAGYACKVKERQRDRVISSNKDEVKNNREYSEDTRKASALAGPGHPRHCEAHKRYRSCICINYLTKGLDPSTWT